MTTSAYQTIWDNRSDAHFRAWGSAMNAALQVVGLVQTTDTGQINWTTITAPGASNTTVGYEIYRFNDTLQATRPVFVRFDYGAGAGSTFLPRIVMSVSNGTNGAGTLNGSLISGSSTINGQSSVADISNQPWYFSGDNSSFVFSFATSFATGGWRPSLFMVERTRNSDGTANGDGLVISSVQGYGSGNSANTYGSATHQVFSWLTTAVSTQRFALPISSPAVYNMWTSGSVGTDILLFPYAVAVPKQEAQALSLLGCYSNDLIGQMTTTVTVNGASHTYLALGNQMFAPTLPGPQGNTYATQTYAANTGVCSLLMRYE